MSDCTHNLTDAINMCGDGYCPMCQKDEIERLRAQLPDGMKDCTIVFKECERGHGTLTATNWVQLECQQCQIESLQKIAIERGDQLISANNELLRLRALLETANIYGAGENAARIAAEAERDRLSVELDCDRAILTARTERMNQLEAERDRLRELLRRVLIGGNHVALLIGADHPLHTAPWQFALSHYGAGDKYEAWCCWKAIMLARDELDRIDAALKEQKK